MLRILIVEDDAQLAATLKYLIEENAFYLVVGTADDTESALYAVDEHNPDVVHELHRALSLTEDLARTGNTSSKGTPPTSPCTNRAIMEISRSRRTQPRACR